MKETGIIMSGNHPRLILDGLKTMSRRVIKPCSPATLHDGSRPDWVFTLAKCPYGQVGDRLWVRETYTSHCDMEKYRYLIFYDNAESARQYTGIIPKHIKDGKHPSIFMPRWASRIERIITLLRAERLRDITEADAQAEGGYSVEEFIKIFLRLNHLSEGANPWNWVIGW